MVERDNRDLQRQIDNLVADVANNSAHISGLQDRADASEARADAAQVRADEIEARSSLDREMIAELQADGVLSKEHAAQLEQALLSSRTIGAAVGILMGSRHVSQAKAFAILKEASQRENRRLRDLAADMVDRVSGGGLIGTPGNGPGRVMASRSPRRGDG